LMAGPVAPIEKIQSKRFGKRVLSRLAQAVLKFSTMST